MVNRPKRIGTAGETGVVRALRAGGFPHAERPALHGINDIGDITGTPGIAWEIKTGQTAKDASPTQIETWATEATREAVNAHADLWVLVVQRRGFAPSRAANWRAITTSHHWATLTGAPTPAVPHALIETHLAHLLVQLRAAGHGTPLEATR